VRGIQARRRSRTGSIAVERRADPSGVKVKPSVNRVPPFRKAQRTGSGWTEADDELGLGAKLFQRWKQSRVSSRRSVA
jgi:hypothetical protein